MITIETKRINRKLQKKIIINHMKTVWKDPYRKKFIKRVRVKSIDTRIITNNKKSNCKTFNTTKD
jgi:hypothetical protein